MYAPDGSVAAAMQAALRRLDLEMQELKDANSQLENDFIRAKQETKKVRSHLEPPKEEQTMFVNQKSKPFNPLDIIV